MTAPAPVDYMGYAAFWSGEFVYAMGGKRTGIVSGNVTEAVWSAEPSLMNWNDSASDMNQVRYLFGYSRVGAFVYLVGGVDNAGQVLDSTEYNVR